MTEAEDLATVPIGEWFKIAPTGLVVRGSPPLSAFAHLGEMLRTFDRTLAFVIGDWINAAEDRFGEEAAQVIDASGWALSTIKTYAWTSKRVPPENRMIDQGLSYAHHQIVGALPEPQQRHWLTQALGDGNGAWPVARLRAAIKAGEDLAPARLWVLVECRDAADQLALVAALERDGRSCRSLERHRA